MKQFILILISFAIGFLTNNYYFKKAWRFDNLVEATAMQAKMSNIRGCVEALVAQDPSKDYYSECEVQARNTYADVYEIMTKDPDQMFEVKKAHK